MPDETTQPVEITPEPAQTPAEPQSALPTPVGSGQTVVDPVAALPISLETGQAPTEPLNQIVVDQATLFQSPPPPAPASAPVEPLPATAPTIQPVVVIQQTNLCSFLAKALEKLRFRKRAKLDKVLKLASAKHSITNDQVQKLLYVSDPTASRYLAQLEKEGKLKKIGKDGSSRYEPS